MYDGCDVRRAEFRSIWIDFFSDIYYSLLLDLK